MKQNMHWSVGVSNEAVISRVSWFSTGRKAASTTDFLHSLKNTLQERKAERAEHVSFKNWRCCISDAGATKTWTQQTRLCHFLLQSRHVASLHANRWASLWRARPRMSRRPPHRRQHRTGTLTKLCAAAPRSLHNPVSEERRGRFQTPGLRGVHGADVCSGAGTPRSGLSLGVVAVALSAAYPLKGGASQTINCTEAFHSLPPGDEPDPNRMWSGGEMGPPPPPPPRGRRRVVGLCFAPPD